MDRESHWLELDTLNFGTARDPPPLEWSILKYGFSAEGGSRCARRDTPPRRSLPSCARWMSWSRKEPRWRMRSARLRSWRWPQGRVAGWGDLLFPAGDSDHHRELETAL